MSYDFLTTYFPQVTELGASRIQEMRSAVSTLIRSVYPDVDTSPNSPFGDLFVSPAAPALAAGEEAFNRILSDLDPENVEGGTVWNCDFVRQFLLTFGVQDEDSQRSYGILRLIFEDSTERDIDRSTTFQVGDGTYRPFVPHPGALTLLPPGEVGSAGTNYRNYTFFGDDSWAVDILVLGNAGQLATAGTQVAVDRTIEGLSAATTLGDFSGGTSPVQLQELARRVRHNFYSRTPTTRGGAQNMIHQQFPEVTLTGCAVSGDYEMMRDLQNPAQVAAGYIDLLVRSETLLTDTVTVRLRQSTGADGNSVYGGWLDLPETPIKLLSFTNNSQTFTPAVYSTSTDTKCPRLTAAYGLAERLLVSVHYAEDSEGNPLIRAGVDAEGVYADFTVSYLFDPTLKVCQEFLLGDDQVPAGLNLYVRWFTPLDVAVLNVDFNRKAGVTLNLEAARAEILSAYNSHSFDRPAGPAAIDAALYYAGAHSVNSVDILANIRYSVADHVWLGAEPPELPTDQATWAEFEAACAAVPELEVVSVISPQVTYADTSENSTLAVSGERNVSYILPTSALTLVERRSV